jgi:hypothetical protein
MNFNSTSIYETGAQKSNSNLKAFIASDLNFEENLSKKNKKLVNLKTIKLTLSRFMQ